MTAPEREALKALIIGAVESIAPPYAENRREGYDWMRDAVIRKIDAVFKVEDASPAVTVTEDARNGDYSDEVSPEAFETIRKSVEGVNSSRLDRVPASPRKSERDAVMAKALAGIEQRASHWAGTFAANPVAEARWSEIARWAHAALKSTTPQTGSQE